MSGFPPCAQEGSTSKGAGSCELRRQIDGLLRDMDRMKVELIRWMVAVAIGQTVIIVTVLRLFP